MSRASILSRTLFIVLRFFHFQIFSVYLRQLILASHSRRRRSICVYSISIFLQKSKISCLQAREGCEEFALRSGLAAESARHPRRAGDDRANARVRPPSQSLHEQRSLPSGTPSEFSLSNSTWQARGARALFRIRAGRNPKNKNLKRTQLASEGRYTGSVAYRRRRRSWLRSCSASLGCGEARTLIA